MIIQWPDGIEYHGTTALREIVQPRVWSSSLWVAADGSAFRKYWNCCTGEWSAFEPVAFSFDNPTQERFGITTPCGGWMSTTRAIATAWLHRAPHSRAHVRLIDPRECPELDNIMWNEPAEEPEAGEIRGRERVERWEELRWCIGPIECNMRYRISSWGRLMNPDGCVTRGFCAYGTRWAAVKGCGLVNLLAAAGLVRDDAAARVAPSVFRAYCAMSCGVHPREHARRVGTAESTAWKNYVLAAPLATDNRYELGARIVSEDLWYALECLRESDDPESVLGASLTELRDHIEEMHAIRVDFAELRFGRACIV